MEDIGTTGTRYWHALDDGRVQCDVCPRGCRMHDGQRGLCFVRGVESGEVRLYTYGRSSGFCVDPIEKKPLNHFLPGTSVLSFGTAGCNLACKFCFHPDTPVATTRGLQRIADLFERCETKTAHGDGWIGVPGSLAVWTRAANRTRVAKIFAHPYSGDLLSLEASRCPPMVLTPNHKVFAAARSRPGEVRQLAAEELTTEHYLVIPRRRPGAGCEIDVLEVLGRLECVAHAPRLRRVSVRQLATALGGSGTSTELGEALGYHPAYLRKLRGQLARGVPVAEQPRTVRLHADAGRIRLMGERGPGLPQLLEFTRDFAWLLGFYCAEGSITAHPERPNSYHLVFSCGHHEQHLVDRAARLLANVLGARSTITDRRTTITVGCRSTSAARLFEALCGRDAKSKHVPAELAETPEAVIRGFLEGYLAGDGYRAETHWVGTTVSRELALGLYELGLHLDLLPTYFVHHPSPTKQIEGRVVSQSTTYIVKFRRDRFEKRASIGPECWRDTGDSFLVPVRSI